MNIRIGKYSFLTLLIFCTLFLSLFSVFALSFAVKKENLIPDNVQAISSPTITITPTFTATVTPSPSPTPSLTPTSRPISNKIIFGIGSQAGPAMDFRLVKESPVKMLTSWYNGPNDLEWMRVQQNDLIPRLYKNKYIVHLITWTDLPEHEISTPYGTACGRPYPVSAQVVEDMRQLADIYKGPGPMYISLFTEFQTFTCRDNNWIGNENYWKTLIDNYRKIKNIFHAVAPNSKVSLSWGGWQSSYDDTVNKGGRSLFPYFADVIRESDFSSFQSMQSDTNVDDIRDMTRILGSYGKPVMMSHYKPSNESQSVYQNDINTIFTDSIMNEIIGNGLFAFSFMDSELIDESISSYEAVKNAVIKYAK